MNRLGGEVKPHILESCSGCGYCFLLCPQGAVQACKGAVYRINEELCNGCGKCVLACPVDAVAGSPVPCPQQKQLNGLEDRIQLADPCSGEEEYEAVVIGSGIGGLLSAAALSQKGIRTALVERLNFAGGRFTHFDYGGASINTGACHALPYGEKGPFAEIVKSLEVPVEIISAGGMGSIYVSGRQYPWREIMDFMVPFSMPDRLELLKIIPKVLDPGKSEPPDLSFGRWLDTQTSSEMVRSFFDRMFKFGCSVGVDAMDYDEGVKVIKNVYRSRAPGVIRGGCGFLVEKLLEKVRSSGGTVLMETEAMAIMTQNGQAGGVKVRNRRSGALKALASKLVISDIGPGETIKLLPDPVRAGLFAGDRHNHVKRSKNGAFRDGPDHTGLQEKRFLANATSGLCINMICDVPLLEYGSILYCLDTKRVAGIARPSAIDPGLAPGGKHLLIAYQGLEGDDPDREMALGLDDLRTMFGHKFRKHCRVVNTGVFKNGWPVNRAAQGRDFPGDLQVGGLYLVGDACKAPGFVMVEGIAARVKEVLERLEGTLVQDPVTRESLKE